MIAVCHRANGTAVAVGLSKLVRLAAAPTFAVLALLASRSGGPMSGLCPSDASPGGMALMYAIMSLVHAPPWLTLTIRKAADHS